MRRDVIVLRALDSTPASRSSWCRRATSPCRDRAFFACSTAAFSLRRDASKRDFHEPASQRAATSAHRNSCARASAVSARARSRSYSNRQSRRWRIGTSSGQVHAPAVRVRAVSESCVAMDLTIAHDGSRYQRPYGRLIPIRDNFPNVVHTGTTERLPSIRVGAFFLPAFLNR